MTVCQWRFVPIIRWVLFSGILLFIGGGDAVASSVVHAMVTDVTNRAEHTQMFLYIHVADVISGFFGPVISVLSMEKGHSWTVLVLAQIVVFSATFSLPLSIPEILHFRNKKLGSAFPPTIQPPTDSSPQQPERPAFSRKMRHVLPRVFNILAPLVRILTSNRQCLLLLAVFAPREFFTAIVPDALFFDANVYAPNLHLLSRDRGDDILAGFSMLGLDRLTKFLRHDMAKPNERKALDKKLQDAWKYGSPSIAHAWESYFMLLLATKRKYKNGCESSLYKQLSLKPKEKLRYKLGQERAWVFFDDSRFYLQESCEYEKIDKRRNPPSSEYTIGLRNRVASLEAFIQELRDASPARRDEMLGPAAYIQGISNISTAGPSQVIQTDTTARARLKPDAEGSLVYHGATSIFNSDLLSTSESYPSPTQSLYAESNFDHVMDHFGIKLEDDTVFKALQQFFRWQYPHFMFVYREAFLRDHFGERKGCKYWSSALLLSICALGLLMSDTAVERNLTEQFFQAAESIVMVSGLSRPSIPTVQSFLCLAFFEIGRGNVSKGWAFSGIAFRMAQDLGFQSDPMNWLPHDSTIISSEDIEIRRRIYWGSYISDKLISLILGRPVQLAFDSAEVDLLEFITDGPGMEYWRPVGFGDDPEELRVLSNIPYLKEQIRLYRIVEKMMTTVFSPRTPRTQTDVFTRQTLLDNLNLELLQWRDALPAFAKWNKWSTSVTITPAVATLHLLYSSIRIALNYESATASNVVAAREAALLSCTTAAQDILALVRIYKMQYGLRHAPLILIYASIQASRSIEKFGIPEEQSYLARCRQ
ncbi:hypothetical protein FACUT_7054 [Fusarium acutatum]|uniref:Xylanolytic transcriptional activator regulatory domain-containing protein n=1 Tax=Fusarium acutatum TaxID=78861 RepID=A0A8H4JPB8_9HYPO|nr:hypothetical protein FACUT_7054 [Fusarium acutatum]